MTIKDLIAILKQYPDDTVVMTDGYENDFDDIAEIRLVKVIKKVDFEWYDGEYEESDEKGGIEVLILPRKKHEL